MRAGRFDWLLAKYRWYRRWRGGHWECWGRSIPMGTIWEQRAHGSPPPPCAMYWPICEDW